MTRNMRGAFLIVILLYSCNHSSGKRIQAFSFENVKIEIMQIAQPDYIRLKNPEQSLFFTLRLVFKNSMDAIEYSPKLTEQYWYQNMVFRLKSGHTHRIDLVYQPNIFTKQQGYLEYVLVLPSIEFKGGTFMLDDYVLNLGIVEMPL